MRCKKSGTQIAEKPHPAMAAHRRSDSYEALAMTEAEKNMAQTRSIEREAHAESIAHLQKFRRAVRT
jgi:hypothetical protein